MLVKEFCHYKAFCIFRFLAFAFGIVNIVQVMYLEFIEPVILSRSGRRLEHNIRFNVLPNMFIRVMIVMFKRVIFNTFLRGFIEMFPYPMQRLLNFIPRHRIGHALPTELNEEVDFLIEGSEPHCLRHELLVIA